jgi:hypothetical protein
MTHGTHDLEKKGVDPMKAKEAAAEVRAAPEPLEGELFTGPASYIRMDMARIKKLLCLGVFDDTQRDNMLRLMGGIMADPSVPASVRVQAFRSISQEGQFLAKSLIGSVLGRRNELASDHEEKDEYHLHLHGDGTLSPAAQMIEDMQALYDAGKEFREPPKPKPKVKRKKTIRKVTTDAKDAEPS